MFPLENTTINEQAHEKPRCLPHSPLWTSFCPPLSMSQTNSMVFFLMPVDKLLFISAQESDCAV